MLDRERRLPTKAQTAFGQPMRAEVSSASANPSSDKLASDLWLE